MMTLEAAFHRSEASFKDALATCRNSSSVRRAVLDHQESHGFHTDARAGTGAHLDALIFGERDSGCQAGDGVTNRDGIIKCSERVEADIETEVNHLLSHVVGEAAAENDNLVIQGDAYLASARFDGSL